jgi:hypothetical protein
VTRAIDLFRLSFDLAVKQKTRSQAASVESPAQAG